MSTNLHWRPVTDGRCIPAYDYALKNALREEFGDGHRGHPRRLTRDALPFLRGLNAANVTGAAYLMDMLEKHDEIEVWEES